MATVITVIEWDSHVELRTVLSSGRHCSVDVHKPRPSFTVRGATDPATVNWSAIGSQTPADAEAYAELICEAARRARILSEAAGA